MVLLECALDLLCRDGIALAALGENVLDALQRLALCTKRNHKTERRNHRAAATSQHGQQKVHERMQAATHQQQQQQQREPLPD